MDITINNRPLSYPKKWIDLTKPQVLEMASIFLASRQDTSLTSLKIQLTTVILPIKKRFWSELEADVKKVHGDDWQHIFNVEVAALIKVTDFFLDEQYRFYPAFQLTKNHFYKTNGVYGPLDKLKNITFGEWALIDTLYVKYVTSNNTQILDTLIAALWRPSKPKTTRNRQRNYDGDRRVGLMIHEPVLQEYAKNKIAKWDAGLKYAIFIFIASCRKAIIERYSYLFKSNTNKNTTAKPQQTDYTDLIIKLAGDKFGDDEQVFNKNAHIILRYMNGLERDRIEKVILG